ncbi:MAG: 4Fe-4S dicluster domain-containing protein [Proteobacteria bacterium]|nr:4Fe-4S dicluster domain-containing protein [Pseudomonadota bacterium]
MDQKELRLIESKCIQEEPPECTAACPIHIDVRTFIANVARGKWEEAWKILRKTMPFPGILGRICDAPCKEYCKRKGAGQAIEIGMLEQACVKTQAPKQRIIPLPKKEKCIAIAVSKLSGLTAAWDLSRKGYEVTIFEAGGELGENLLSMPDEMLPHDLVREELGILFSLGVEAVLNSSVDDEKFLSDLLNRFDALYVGPDDGGLSSNFLERENVFSGGFSHYKAKSPVWQAAEGRWAATSIDRYLQKVSQTAGREKDGPFPTRLYTNIDNVAFATAVKPLDDESGYTPQEAMQEAGRCLHCECLECVKACSYLEKFGSYPRKYSREIYNNSSIVMGPRQANKLVNSCSLCGLCEAICPENFAMQTLCLEARRDMVQKGKMPVSAHEFALLDMQFSNSDRFAMAQHETGHESSAYVFFPGCQLCASSPDKVKNVYAHLRETLSGGVGLMLGCCNAPAFWAGEEELFEKQFSIFSGKWADLGRPQIILACSTCYKIFKENLNKANIVSLWSILDETGLPRDCTVIKSDVPLALHDPCTTRYESALQNNVRNLLQKIDQPFLELTAKREYAECCGYGGLMQNANPDLAKTVIKRLAGKSSADYVTYCAVCRDNLAGAEKRTVHILDLIFNKDGESVPAARKRPGWSQRQENRLRLKHDLLSDLWAKDETNRKDNDGIVLNISSEVWQILEDRRILVTDLEEVIRHAETSGQKFFNPDTRHFKTSLKLYNTTFWLEYTTSDNGFTIYNAYSHRMVVSGKEK